MLLAYTTSCTYAVLNYLTPIICQVLIPWEFFQNFILYIFSLLEISPTGLMWFSNLYLCTKHFVWVLAYICIWVVDISTRYKIDTLQQFWLFVYMQKKPKSEKSMKNKRKKRILFISKNWEKTLKKQILKAQKSKYFQVFGAEINGHL